MGADANEPSPRKIVESSHFVSWAASLIVNGRTRTVTEIEDAPSEMAISLVSQGSQTLSKYNTSNGCRWMSNVSLNSHGRRHM